MNRPNLNLYPPEGYKYTDRRNGGLVYEGGNWPEVFEKMRADRIRNKWPAGDPQAEVFEWFCSQYPRYCRDRKMTEAFERMAETPVGFAHTMMNWVGSVFDKVQSGKLGYVGEEQTEARIKICASCKFQRGWSVGCVGCARNFTATTGILLAKRPPGANSNALGGCEALKEETRVSTHLNLQPRADAPEWCWRRST